MRRRGLGILRSARVLGLIALLTCAIAVPARAAEDREDPALTYQWALRAVNARAAHTTGTGRGTVIAVLDSGVDFSHEDLDGKLLPGLNVDDPGAAAQDDNGQGTHVAGIAAALTENGKGIAGVAPDARILPVKVLDASLDGSSNDFVAGIRWAADQKAEVISVSLTSNFTLNRQSLIEAVRYAWSRGSILVFASGSDALLAADFADEPAIVVAATTRTDAQPTYSRGVGSARWALAAPGGAGAGSDDDDVLSTYWPHTERTGAGTREFGRYAYLAGTPMAAAHVAGAAAVLRSLGLPPQRTVERLIETARDIGPDGRDGAFGAGMLDLGRAVRGLRPAPSTPPSTAAPGTTTTTAAAPGAGTSTTIARAVNAPPPGPAAATTVPPPNAPAPPEEAVPQSGLSAGPTVAVTTESPGGSGGTIAVVSVLAMLAAGSALVLWRRRVRVGEP